MIHLVPSRLALVRGQEIPDLRQFGLSERALLADPQHILLWHWSFSSAWGHFNCKDFRQDLDKIHKDMTSVDQAAANAPKKVRNRVTFWPWISS